MKKTLKKIKVKARRYDESFLIYKNGEEVIRYKKGEVGMACGSSLYDRIRADIYIGDDHDLSIDDCHSAMDKMYRYDSDFYTK